MIGKRIIFREYFLFFVIKTKGEIMDKCRTFFGDRYLVKWYHADKMFCQLIKPERICEIL